MDEDTQNDLKQFMTSLISQQLSEVRKEIGEDIKALDIKLSGKIDNLSGSIAEALSTSNDETDKQLEDHELRLTSLEHAKA